MRVPVPNVSLIEFVFTNKNLTVDKINDCLTKSSKSDLKGVLDVTNEKLVSIDFNHNSNSAIVDLSLTKVVGKGMGKISAWYDNEWGFSNRMCDLVKYIHKKFNEVDSKDLADLDQKILLLRLDLNVPIKNEKIQDFNRIDKTLPTIKFLLKRKAKIILISHVGRPMEKRFKIFSETYI